MMHSDNAPFITFYSFKGGLGRSISSLSTASILSALGYRVLVIDFNLENPGITYLLNRYIEKEKSPVGIIDLLLQGITDPKQGDLFYLDPIDLATKYTHPYNIPGEFNQNKGTFYIMPTAHFKDGTYGQRLNDLNLQKLYKDGYGWRIFQAFKSILKDSKKFDYIIVDTNNGFSSEAGICTRDLADYLVIFTGLNYQNIEGTIRFLNALKLSEPSLRDILIVLSPKPSPVEDYIEDMDSLNTRWSKILKEFSNIWEKEIDQTLHIPYFTQIDAEELNCDYSYIYNSYHNLAKLILTMTEKSKVKIEQ
ncbi:MAG: ParA family protein [archaeon]